MKQEITKPKSHYSMIPNIYDESDLDVYEHRLLLHYNKVGDCYENTSTTARVCNMSVGKVSGARKSLAKKGFIDLGKKKHSNSKKTIQIAVVDKWEENFAYYRESSPGELANREESSPGETKKTLKKALTVPKEGTVVEPQYVEAGKEFEALEKKEPKKVSKHSELVGALSNVTGMSIRKHAPRLGRAAKKLSADNNTAEQVQQAFGDNSPWYSQHWIGKKGDKPTPEFVVEQIDNLLEEPQSIQDQSEAQLKRMYPNEV